MNRWLFIFKNKSIIIFPVVYITGIIYGIVLSKNYIFNRIDTEFSLFHLISIFLVNFFSVFILIITRKTTIILIEIIFFIYFRGFSLGVLILYLFNINFTWLLIIIIIELTYLIIIFKMILFDLYNINIYDTHKMLYYSMFIICIYSIILEIVGDRFG